MSTPAIIVPKSLVYNFPRVTAAGILGPIIFDNISALRPANHTIDVSVSGTAPTACTWRTEGSSDGVVWYGLDITAPGTNSGTASMMEHIAQKPVLQLRINVVTYTGVAATVVLFHYTGKP